MRLFVCQFIARFIAGMLLINSKSTASTVSKVRPTSGNAIAVNKPIRTAPFHNGSSAGIGGAARRLARWGRCFTHITTPETQTKMTDRQNLSGIRIDGDKTLTFFGFDTKHSGQILSLRTDPLDDRAGHVLKGDKGLL